MSVTRITPMSEQDITDASQAIAALASDIAAGMARTGAPRITRTANRIVLTYDDGQQISYVGDFNIPVRKAWVLEVDDKRGNTTMNRSEAIAYLTRCADNNGVHWYQGRPWSDIETCPTCHGTNDAGHLSTAGSRYGRTSVRVAEFVWRVALAERETDPSEAFLDHVMNMAINDSETPQMWLNQYAAELAGADVDAMVTGYLDCQLWAQTDYDRDDDSTGEPKLDENYDISDVSDDYRESVRDELAALVAEHPLAVRMYLNRLDRPERNQYNRNELFGHDFYLTRERHGAGFWDRGLGELGDYLTDIAKWAGAASDLWDNGNGELTA